MGFAIGDLRNKEAKNAKNAVLVGGVRCLVGSAGGFVVVSRFHSKRNPTSSGIYELENPSPCEEKGEGIAGGIRRIPASSCLKRPAFVKPSFTSINGSPRKDAPTVNPKKPIVFTSPTIKQ